MPSRPARRAQSATLARLALTGAAHAVETVDHEPRGGTPDLDSVVEDDGTRLMGYAADREPVDHHFTARVDGQR